jgi:DNA-binding CsgD family transcriptional regulator
MYFTGDGCRRDEDGYYWITGRVDDVINVSGHRMGTAEVESALVAHAKVAEAAVVGYPHDIKGQGIYAYVTLKLGATRPSEELRKELVSWVRKEIGPIATPDVIQWAPGLPKTRSGKIMRRILRKIADLRFIEDAIRDALSGKRMESPKDDVLDPVAAQIASLTPTQLKVMLGVMEGRLNKQIAYDLGISEATVKAHMTAILKKLDVQNRTQAVLAAKALGMSIVHN